MGRILLTNRKSTEKKNPIPPFFLPHLTSNCSWRKYVQKKTEIWLQFLIIQIDFLGKMCKKENNSSDSFLKRSLRSQPEDPAHFVCAVIADMEKAARLRPCGLRPASPFPVTQCSSYVWRLLCEAGGLCGPSPLPPEHASRAAAARAGNVRKWTSHVCAAGLRRHEPFRCASYEGCSFGDPGVQGSTLQYLATHLLILAAILCKKECKKDF